MSASANQPKEAESERVTDVRFMDGEPSRVTFQIGDSIRYYAGIWDKALHNRLHPSDVALIERCWAEGKKSTGGPASAQTDAGASADSGAACAVLTEADSAESPVVGSHGSVSPSGEAELELCKLCHGVGWSQLFGESRQPCKLCKGVAAHADVVHQGKEPDISPGHHWEKMPNGGETLVADASVCRLCDGTGWKHTYLRHNESTEACPACLDGQIIEACQLLRIVPPSRLVAALDWEVRNGIVCELARSAFPGWDQGDGVTVEMGLDLIEQRDAALRRAATPQDLARQADASWNRVAAGLIRERDAAIARAEKAEAAAPDLTELREAWKEPGSRTPENWDRFIAAVERLVGK